ncbi:hypothetical protein LIER_42087 [Lithospermum erythrorhizon]|uniref:Uncharacterized protein n=1 Tax=Lithospermum erythrorhizon TaxID=34254 RepID=A0AAV3RJA1_LITER
MINKCGKLPLAIYALVEDQNIDPKKLYHLWIAEDLISKRYCLKGETLMDVADRVDDMMRESCLTRAREEYFLETLTNEAGSFVIGDSLYI